MTDLFNDVALFVILASTVVLIFFLLLLKEKELKVNLLLFTLMSLVFISIVISALINNDISLFYQALVIYFSYLGLAIMHNRIYLKDGLGKMFKIVLITQTPLVFTVFYGFDFPLQGIFYNPNSMGLTAATVYVIILTYLLANLEQELIQNGKFLTAKNLFITMLCMFLFLVTVGSESRTSSVTIAVATALAVVVILFKGLTSKRYKSTFKSIFATLLMPFILFLVYNFPPLKTYLYNNILYKFEARAASDNMLSTRDIAWQKTINDATMFGNGREYFDQQVGIQAHNTFISFLGQYGWITLILFILFLLVSARYALIFARRDQSKYKYTPLFLILSFVLLSTAEIMTHKALMFAMFSTIGFVSIKSHRKTARDEQNIKIQPIKNSKYNAPGNYV